MRFREFFEQFGKPVAFGVPSKIAALNLRPDYRQQTQPTPYRVPNPPSYMSTVDQPSVSRSQTKPVPDRPQPIKIGKEIIRPNDSRYAAIMSLLSRQKQQP